MSLENCTSDVVSAEKGWKRPHGSNVRRGFEPLVYLEKVLETAIASEL